MDDGFLLQTKYLRIYHSTQMFALGISIDTEIGFLTIEIGTLQFIFGY